VDTFSTFDLAKYLRPLLLKHEPQIVTIREFVTGNEITRIVAHRCVIEEREFVTSNDKPRIVAYRYIIEASIDVS
jgi:hypothetical protein